MAEKGQNYYPPIQQQPQAGYYTTPGQTVVVQQPGQIVQTVTPRDWTFKTFDCFGDMGICLMGWCCPCIMMCDVGNQLGESGCGVYCCVPNSLQVLRMKLRAQQRIQGTVLSDCLCVTFCGVCVLCQMKREINHLQAAGQLNNEV